MRTRSTDASLGSGSLLNDRTFGDLRHSQRTWTQNTVSEQWARSGLGAWARGGDAPKLPRVIRGAEEGLPDAAARHPKF